MWRPFYLMLIAAGLTSGWAASAVGLETPRVQSGALSTWAARYQLGARSLDGAVASMTVALVQEERAHGAASLQAATALSRLALLQAAKGRVPDALKLYARALRIREHRPGRNSLGVAKSLENLARVHLALASWCCDFDAPPVPHASIARKLFKRSLRIRFLQLGPYHPDIADAIYNLAAKPEYSPRIELLPLYKRALFVREKAFGQNSPRVVESLFKLADLEDNSSKPDNPSMVRQRTEWCENNRAVTALRRRGLAIDERALGPDASELKEVLSKLARESCTETGEPDERLALRKRILAIDEKANGSESIQVAHDLEDLLSLLDSPVDAAEKRGTELRANRIREAYLSRDKLDRSRRCGAERLDRRQLAAKFDEQADLAKIEIVDDTILDEATEHQTLPSCRSTRQEAGGIVQTYERLGDLVSAERVLRSNFGDESLGRFLVAHGRLAEAAPLYKTLIPKLHDAAVDDRPSSDDGFDRRRTYYHTVDEYVAVLRKQNAINEAEPLLDDALAVEESAKEPNHLELVRRIDALGDLLASLNRKTDALSHYQQALQLAEKAAVDETNVHDRSVRKVAVLHQLDKLISFDVAAARFDEADALYRKSLLIEQPDYETIEVGEPIPAVRPAVPAKPAIIDRLDRYAAFRRERQDAKGADALHKRALAIWAVELEQDMRNAATLLKPGADRDWYDIKRLNELVPIYRELSDTTDEEHAAALLTAAKRRQDRANSLSAK